MLMKKFQFQNSLESVVLVKKKRQTLFNVSALLELLIQFIPKVREVNLPKLFPQVFELKQSIIGQRYDGLQIREKKLQVCFQNIR